MHILHRKIYKSSIIIIIWNSIICLSLVWNDKQSSLKPAVLWLMCQISSCSLLLRLSFSHFVNWGLIHLQILGHSCGQVIQSWALLHHPGWNMSGLPVHLQPYRQAPHSLLLPPAAGNRPVPCHELLRSGHQGAFFNVDRAISVMFHFLWQSLKTDFIFFVVWDRFCVPSDSLNEYNTDIVKLFSMLWYLFNLLKSHIWSNNVSAITIESFCGF